MFNEHFRFFYGWLQHLRFFTSVLVWCIVNWCQLCIGCRRSPAWDADLIPQRGSGLRTHPWHRAKGRTCSHWAHTGLTLGSHGFPVLLPRFSSVLLTCESHDSPCTSMSHIFFRISFLVSSPKHGLSTVRFEGFEHLYSFMQFPVSHWADLL